MIKKLCILLSLSLLPWAGKCQVNKQFNQEEASRYNRLFGTAFPIMDLELPDSTFFNTASLATKTVFVDCWFTACPPCLQEIPYARSLQQFFAADTNVVFLNICIENKERKDAWRQLIQNKNIGGINVFYARNQPQKVNLLRRLGVNDYPTYLLVHNLSIMGANAPRPSDNGFVHWAIYAAGKNQSLASAYHGVANKSSESQEWLRKNWPAIEALEPRP